MPSERTKRPWSRAWQLGSARLGRLVKPWPGFAAAAAACSLAAHFAGPPIGRSVGGSARSISWPADRRPSQGLALSRRMIVFARFSPGCHLSVCARRLRLEARLEASSSLAPPSWKPNECRRWLHRNSRARATDWLEQFNYLRARIICVRHFRPPPAGAAA